MNLTFTKMNGAGNDFVVMDNRDRRLNLSQRQIAALCERHRGVGADGVMLVEPPEGEATARMRYYNADGGEAEMCGNGARCFAKYVNRLHHDSLAELSFETIAGVIRATFPGDRGDVCVQLSPPFDWKLDQALSLPNGDTRHVHFVNTGVPHAVLVVDDLESVDIRGAGSAVRHHDHFAILGQSGAGKKTHKEQPERRLPANALHVSDAFPISRQTTPTAVALRGIPECVVGSDGGGMRLRGQRLSHRPCGVDRARREWPADAP